MTGAQGHSAHSMGNAAAAAAAAAAQAAAAAPGGSVMTVGAATSASTLQQSAAGPMGVLPNSIGRSLSGDSKAKFDRGIKVW